MKCHKCGGPFERFVNMSDEPEGALFLDFCSICGRYAMMFEERTDEGGLT